MDLNTYAANPRHEVNGDDLLRHCCGRAATLEWHFPPRHTVPLWNGTTSEELTSHGEVLIDGIELIKHDIDPRLLTRSESNSDVTTVVIAPGHASLVERCADLLGRCASQIHALSLSNAEIGCGASIMQSEDASETIVV
ncbi:hypothetical protein AB0N71_10600 [Pseudarthrobacter enclensis]|uniref:hypothetical protein n=1 Tax=Pseudarthrobacter enclensis TaxID=993070 RepID=UPI00341B88B3